jgi:ABC-type nickel/cobalt efflux system permease component RcnA
VVLGLTGIAFGLSLARLEAFEASRGSLAAWGLILFGLAYAVWGLRRAVRGHTHTHVHVHANGTLHTHEHRHEKEHLHAHAAAASGVDGENLGHTASASGARMTPWVLFVIFLFGPCEALIPLLMFPAATESVGALLLVTLTFGATTVATMLGAVLIGTEGLRWASFERSPLRRLAPYGHLAAGVTVLLCGVAIQFLGL